MTDADGTNRSVGPGLLRGLSGKVLALTIVFVMLGEVLIFLPSIANFRIQWLKGRVAQAPLAQELKKLFANDEVLGGARKAEAFRDDSKRFFGNYFKQISNIFEPAWNGRKYSIKSAAALRAFIRVAPDVVEKIDHQHADRLDGS